MAILFKGLPVSKNSCHAIYCSHVLEHLSLDDFRTALKNTYGYLMPGGYFRVVVPNLKSLAQSYVESTDPQASFKFLRNSRLGKERSRTGLTGMLSKFAGTSERHLWMWDAESMAQELKKAGFSNIRLANYGDSSVVRFEDVEEERRWKQGFGMECIK